VPIYTVFVSGELSAFPFTLDAPPAIGDFVTPDDTDWLVCIDEIEGETYLGVRIYGDGH
jgi:hypothetical protein